MLILFNKSLNNIFIMDLNYLIPLKLMQSINFIADESSKVQTVQDNFLFRLV